MQTWIKEGLPVTGNYMGVKIEGIVVESRVKYGGKVCHTVELNAPIQLPWNTTARTRVIVDDEQIVVGC